MASKLVVLRGIVQQNQPGVVDRFVVSPQTAAQLVAVHDRLSPPFRKKFLAQRVDVMRSLVLRR